MVYLPKFLGIGAAKSGTTSLHDILSKHPELFLPQKKELAFFCTEHHFREGLKKYASNFEKAGDKTCGEITPQYMYSDEAFSRVVETLGSDIKIIVMLRNPADRAYSHYQHMRFRGQDTLSFQEALKAEPTRLRNNVQSRFKYSYLDRGYYARQLKPWIERFGIDNIFIIIFETDFRGKALNHTLTKLQKFLGVKAIELDINTHSNRSKSTRFVKLNRFLFNKLSKARWLYTILIPSQKLRRQILDFISNIGAKETEKLSPILRQQIITSFYMNDIFQLEELLQRDLAHWYTN